MFSKVRSQKLEVRSQKNKSKILFVICFFVFGFSTYAQCAMCRAALTSEGNTAKAQAVNDGIVYLMVIPYLLVAGIAYYIYRMWKNKK
ncbi:hypothetical protein [Flavobacterium eburneipallidum]|uniref:hypothetical protein n=1 Tax=Flavobacterium eburneipallidum TaxID=3003263 RepID=UPI0022AC72F0|nr:hypothetical protein [Flavobacterium eburneipallidum]